MLAILQRLESCTIDFPTLICDEKAKVWSFSEKINRKNAIFFRYLVTNHWQLCFEYNVLCTQLAHDLMREGVKISEVTQQLQAALVMSELLEHVYRDYLVIPREVNNCRREQEIYRQLLALDGYQFPDQDNHEKAKSSPSSPTKTIRDLTVSSNWPRLMLLRTRRLLISITPLIHGFDAYPRWIGLMEVSSNLVIPYLAWIFFLPRLLTNLFLFGKHLIPGSWMHAEERSLDWQSRFKAQIERRWFEIGNDAAWFTGGLINCFVLIGVLAPVALYVSLTLQTYDVILSAIRFHIEISRMHQLEQDYKRRLSQLSSTDPAYAQTSDYLKHLEERIHYEKKRLSVSIINNCVLVISLLLTLGVLSFTPVAPLVGAILAVGITIACYVAVKCIDHQKPKPMEVIKKVAHDKNNFFSREKSNSTSSSSSSLSSPLDEHYEADAAVP